MIKYHANDKKEPKWVILIPDYLESFLKLALR